MSDPRPEPPLENTKQPVMPAETAKPREVGSDATLIEQQRAIAQVKAAMAVAQQFPRNTIDAGQRIQDACARQDFADRAFFSFPRGGTTVTGPSIHFATEIARCWGNVEFGIAELRRDDIKGESEMHAFGWDLEVNVRVTNTFLVPHLRDLKSGPPRPLVQMRDIYENNANQGARRLRECILRILPTYIVEEAKTAAHKTLAEGGGVAIEERRAKLIEAYAAMGITQKQIERRFGKTADKLGDMDIANLRILYRSLQQGEVDKDHEFDPAHAGDIEESLKAAGKDKPADNAPETKKGKAAKTSKKTPTSEDTKEDTEPDKSAALLTINRKDGEPAQYESLESWIKAMCHDLNEIRDPEAFNQFWTNNSRNLAEAQKIDAGAIGDVFTAYQLGLERFEKEGELAV